MKRCLGLAFITVCCTSLLAAGIQLTQETPGDAVERPFAMKALLARAAAYFQRLEEMSIQYYCREAIREAIFPIPQKYKGYFIFKTGPEDLWVKLHFGDGQTNEWLHDYQVIRRGRSVKERRHLLRENGVEKHKQNVSLKTSIFNFDTMILGPMVFDSSNQKRYDFSFTGREQALGREAIVIESKPRSTGAEEMAWGKYWIDVNDSSFIRMEFSQTSIRNFSTIEKKAEALQSRPEIGLLLECGVEKGGIRFPTRFSLEEAYIHQDSTRFVLSTLDVKYDDYRFFAIDVKVDEKKENR